MLNLKKLIVSLAIPIAVGISIGLLTKDSMNVYAQITKPTLAPPSWLFPVAWSILYILMGISCYLIWNSDSPKKNMALTIYGIQLLFNAIWPFLFFSGKLFTLSFIWLVLLLILVILMIVSFSEINKKASAIQIPYLLWLIFAGYLNLSVALLN